MTDRQIAKAAFVLAMMALIASWLNSLAAILAKHGW